MMATVLALTSAACRGRPQDATLGAGTAQEGALRSRYRLDQVNGHPLPATVIGSATLRMGDTIVYVRSGSLAKVGRDTLRLDVYLVTAVCEAEAVSACLLTGRGGPVSMKLGYQLHDGRLRVRWPSLNAARPDVTDGLVTRDSLSLGMPFRKVFETRRPDSTWVAHFRFRPR